MPQAKERGPEVAHTPATPGLNAPPGVPGPACAFAGANHHAHTASVGHNETPQGVGFWITVSLATGRRGRGFVDEGRESPASRVAAHTPRRRENPPHTRHTPSQPGNMAGRRRGLREDPAGLNSRPRRTPTPGTTRNPTTPAPTPTHPATMGAEKTGVTEHRRLRTTHTTPRAITTVGPQARSPAPTPRTPPGAPSTGAPLGRGGPRTPTRACAHASPCCSCGPGSGAPSTPSGVRGRCSPRRR